MWTNLYLSDKCSISYITSPKLIRRFHFKYTTFNGIKHIRAYDIYLVDIGGKDYFKVTEDFESPQYFESYEHASAYVFKECGRLQSNIMKEEEQIRTYIETKNKRKKGVKVS